MRGSTGAAHRPIGDEQSKQKRAPGSAAPGSEFKSLLDSEAALLKIYPKTLPKMARRGRSGGHLDRAAVALPRPGAEPLAGNDRNGGAPNKL